MKKHGDLKAAVLFLLSILKCIKFPLQFLYYYVIILIAKSVEFYKKGD